MALRAIVLVLGVRFRQRPGCHDRLETLCHGPGRTQSKPQKGNTRPEPDNINHGFDSSSVCVYRKNMNEGADHQHEHKGNMGHMPGR
jgi:hypothetical protein